MNEKVQIHPDIDISSRDTINELAEKNNVTFSAMCETLITEALTTRKSIFGEVHPHICLYKRSIDQEYPRRCISCGKKEDNTSL
jgi:hypothetical protein